MAQLDRRDGHRPQVPRAAPPDQPKDKPPVGPLQDVQRALSLVRGKAKEWGIDPQRIGVLGFSAGGHLAAATATNFDKRAYESLDDTDKVSCRPDFAVLVYPAYLTVKDKDELCRTSACRKKRLPASSPTRRTMASRPRTACRCTGRCAKPAPAELHLYASGAMASACARATSPAPPGRNVAPNGCRSREC